MAFGIGTPPDASSIYTVWVDDLSLLGTSTRAESRHRRNPHPNSLLPLKKSAKALDPCPGALILPMSVIWDVT